MISTLNLLLKCTFGTGLVSEVAHTLAMDADKVVVVEGDKPRCKSQRLTDFFERLPQALKYRSSQDF